MASNFSRPPNHLSLLPMLYDWHYDHSPDHPLFTFESTPEPRVITWREGLQAVQRASNHARAIVDKDALESSTTRPAFAILSTGDALSYFIFILGALRLGWAVHPISHKLSPPVIATLLVRAGATHLMLSADSQTQEAGNAAVALASEQLSRPVYAEAIPTYDVLFPTCGPDPDFSFEPTNITDLERVVDLPALFLHTSGTTGQPKTVPWTQHHLAQGAAVPALGNIDLVGKVFGCQAAPMFAAMSAINMFCAPTRGMTLAFFAPRPPPMDAPDPVNLIASALASRCNYLMCVPAFIETWAKDPATVDKMVAMDGFIWGGAPLSKYAGDLLISRGVNLYLTYGSTETGLIASYVSDFPGSDWQYFDLTPNRDIRFSSDSRGTYTATVVQSEDYDPCVPNTTVDGRPAYLMPDVFAEHPTRKGLWKIAGRGDDVITLSTGQKLHPVVLEGMLSANPRIKAVIFFGSGRTHCGLLVEPSEPCPDSIAEKEFIDEIWPWVERMNESAPTHTRIFRRMIVVTTSQKPFTYTPKGVPRRHEMLEKYTEEIERAYKAAEEDAETELGVKEPEEWTVEEIARFVREVVGTTIKRTSNIPDDADLFREGCTSLEATWIRNALLRALRRPYPAIAQSLPATFVYSHPSIAALTTYITDAVTLGGDLEAGGDERRLMNLLEEYSRDLSPPSEGDKAYSDTVLLTGATGSLGAVLLAQLLSSTKTSRVYAFTRKPAEQTNNSKTAHLRLSVAVSRAGYDGNILDQALAMGRLVYVSGDLSQPNMGLSDSVQLEAIKGQVTCILHCAWTVDFKRSITSFKSDLAGLRHLIDLALSCARGRRAPPKLVFISSISVAHGLSQSGEIVREAPLTSPRVAVGSGYAESKWVAEAVLARAALSSGLPIEVVRLGQVAGAPNGRWKEQEWLPSLIKSSLALGSLPDVDGKISWLPASDAARAILDVVELGTDAKTTDTNGDGPCCRFFHVMHPTPSSWSDLLEAFSARLGGIPLIPYTEWLEVPQKEQDSLARANASSLARALETNPALRLLDFFEGGRVNNSAVGAVNGNSRVLETIGLPRLDCTKAVELLPSLAALASSGKQLGSADVEKWVGSWEESGFLDRNMKKV